MTEASHCSDKGPHRQRNEDVAFAASDEGIFVVADGLGGAAAGDRAARVATETLTAVLRCPGDPRCQLKAVLEGEASCEVLEAVVPPNQDLTTPAAHLRFAFLVAHCAVLAEARRSGFLGMGTAMIVAWHAQDGWWIGHVGDCRAYALEGDRLLRLTRDHSLSAALEGRACLPRGAEDSAFLRSRLTQVVGGETAPAPDVNPWTPALGARLLLCSDGVWGSLTDEELREQLAGSTSPQETSRKLVQRAIRAGSRDNVTALVVAL